MFQILRVQNRHLYSQYKARQGALHEKNSRDSQQLLWHGTSEECVNKIINNGFDRSYCGRNGKRLDTPSSNQGVQNRARENSHRNTVIHNYKESKCFRFI